MKNIYNLDSQHGKEIHDILALTLRCCEDSPEARINMTDVTVSLIKIKTSFIQWERKSRNKIK